MTCRRAVNCYFVHNFCSLTNNFLPVYIISQLSNLTLLTEMSSLRFFAYFYVRGTEIESVPDACF